MLRTSILAIAAVMGLAGCAGVEHRDTNAAVDRNPLCASRSDRPGEPLDPACERKSETRWSSERKDSAPVDFGPRRGDD